MSEATRHFGPTHREWRRTATPAELRFDDELIAEQDAIAAEEAIEHLLAAAEKDRETNGGDQ